MIVEILLCAHSRHSQLIYVTVCGPRFIPSESSRSCGFMFSLLSQRGCATYSCCWYTVFNFLSPEKLKDLTERMNSSLNTGIFLSFSSSRPPKFDRNSAPRPVAHTFPWHVIGKQLFLCLPHESLFTGDLLTAKELLAQMKYFTNIEEKVKDRITESCWGKIVNNLQL